MKEVWKYTFDDGVKLELNLPIGATIRHVDSQKAYGDRNDKVHLWIELDVDWEVECEGEGIRTFYLIATGERIPPKAMYIGSAKCCNGNEVWHVYEIPID